MSNSVQAKASSSLDGFKWVVVVALVVAGVYGNSFYANDYSVLIRAAVLVPMAAVAVWVALATARGAAFGRLMKESRAEIRRVVWPTRQETTQTTLVVVLVVAVAALVLWGLDWVLNLLISQVIG